MTAGHAGQGGPQGGGGADSSAYPQGSGGNLAGSGLRTSPDAGVTAKGRRRKDGWRRSGNGDRPGISMVPEAEFRSYYGRQILKDPAWTIEVPWYLFFGGISGVSATMAATARTAGQNRLADRALAASAVSLGIGIPLLISDLGRPERFHNMLRVFKPTSAMSMGSWILTGFANSLAGAVGITVLGRFRPLGRALEIVAGLFGPAMATYTAVLVADTAIPVWHEAYAELPVVFAGGAAASAGGLLAMLTPGPEGAPARHLAVAGALAELVGVELMSHHLGELGEPYREGPAGRFAKLAKACVLAGGAATALGARRRPLAVAGGSLLLAGSAFERLAVYKAGFQSARNPKYVVKPQRARVDAGKAVRR